MSDMNNLNKKLIIRKKINKKKLLTYVKTIVICSFAFAVMLPIAQRLIFADNGSVYIGDLLECRDSGYVSASFNFGSFPQKEITASNDPTTYNYLSSSGVADGYTISYGGNTYLREVDKNNVNHYYKFEPIEWEILRIDSDKVLAISKYAIDAHQLDSITEYYHWDGTVNGAMAYADGNGRYAYPMLRLYLNSYDCSHAGYKDTTTIMGSIAYSKLNYTPNSSAKFRSRGFYEKAFSDSEKSYILKDDNELKDSSVDGINACNDYVRIATYEEMKTSNAFAVKYWFNSEKHRGIYSSRFGLATDYSSNLTSVSSTFPGNDKTNHKGIDIWMKSRKKSDFYGSDNHIITKEGIDSSNNDTSTCGIRPMITLKASTFNNKKIKMSAGSYLEDWGLVCWYKNGQVDTEHSSDTFETTLADVKNYKAKVDFLYSNWTQDGIEYTSWFATNHNGENHGYIYFGSFPNREITKTNDSALYTYLSGLSDDSFPDGKMVVYEGKKYLRQDKENGKRYFEVEPIKWNVIKKLNGNLLLISEACLESKAWDTQKSTYIYWDGKGGDTSGTKKSYPMIRLYLNSYDTTIDYESLVDNERTSYSELKYSPNQFDKFSDKGFLEKAFNSGEQSRIKPDHNESLKSISSNETPCNDKVRLLGYYETFNMDFRIQETVYGIGSSYGFTTFGTNAGISTNRLGFITDYSALLSSEQPSNSYSGYSTLNRKTEKWWTITRNGAYAYVLGTNGMSSCYNNSLYSYVNLNMGVRPVISLDVSGLTKTSGDGSLSNPYSYESKIIVSSDDINDKENLDWYLTGTNVELSTNIIPGNTIEGWYDGNTLLSNDSTYTCSVGTNDKEYFVKVNITEEGAINASNSSKEIITLMLNDSRYLSIIDASDDTDNVSNILKRSSKYLKRDLVDLIFERKEKENYLDLSNLKTDIKILADGLELIPGGSGSNKTVTINHYDPQLTYVLQKKTGSKSYVDVGTFTSDTYDIDLIDSSETYRVVLRCESLDEVESADTMLTSALKLTYEFNGGTGSSSYKELSMDDTLGILPIPTKAGYTFGGWFNDEQLLSEVDSSQTIQSNKTIYAKWNPISYKVRYKGNGSSSGLMSEDTFTYGESGQLSLNTYERKCVISFNANGGISEKSSIESSYEFLKWNTESDGTGTDLEDGASVLTLSNVDDDIVNLYAQWSPVSITLPAATRDGYTFDGWYKDDTFTFKIGDANFDFMPSVNETFVAKWTPIVVTNKLIYDTCGGSDGPNSQTYSPSYPYTSSTFTLSGKKPTKSGYIFDWWYTDPIGGDKLDDELTLNDDYQTIGVTQTVYAHYTGVPVDNKLIYDDNGGENGPGVVFDTTYYPNTQSSFNLSGITPTKTGSGFVGWFTDPNDGVEVTFPLNVGSANSLTGSQMKVYAHYEVGQYKNRLHYDLDGGTNGPSDVSIDVSYSNSTCQFTVDSTTKPEKSGYEFAGWFYDKKGGDKVEGTIDFGEPYSLQDQTLILYAHYTPKCYTNTLIYDANGGTNSPDSESLSVIYPTTVIGFNISKAFPTRDGYTFDGWYTKATNGSKVEDSYDVGKINNAGNQEVTLYAHWKLNEYSIDIDLDGGSVLSPNRANYNVNTNSFDLINPTKPGFTFEGWTGTGIAIPNQTVTITKGSFGDKSFKANWLKNPDAQFVVNHYLIKSDKSGYEFKESEINQAPYDSEIEINSFKKTFSGYVYEGGKAEAATDVRPTIFETKTTVLQNGSREINLYYTKEQPTGGGGSSGGGGSVRTKIVEVVKEPEKELTKETVKTRTEFNSYINGYDDGEFKPRRNVTRAEFAKVIAMISDDYALKDKNEYTSYVRRYKDVRDDFWNTPYIGYVISNDSMTGYPDGLFKPESYITRAEVCKVLTEIFDIKDEGVENKFANEIKGQWFEEPVDKLVKAGYINGYKDGTFGASRNINRAELIALINRIRGDKLDKEQIEKIANEKGTVYKDVKEKDWFYIDVLEASIDHQTKDDSLADTIISPVKVAEGLIKDLFTK